MEEIYLLKIGPDFIGWSVIRGNDYEKNSVVSIIKTKQNKELKTAWLKIICMTPWYYMV